jgi:hypothetical protein
MKAPIPIPNQNENKKTDHQVGKQNNHKKTAIISPKNTNTLGVPPEVLGVIIYIYYLIKVEK